MHKRLWSFILTAGLMLTLTPNTAMAANAERTQTSIRETTVLEEQSAPATQPKTTKKQAAVPVAVPADLEGSGTVTDPYRIKDAAQLRSFADAVNGVNGTPNTGICAVLTQNINLSGVCGADIGSWTPIGTNTNPYRGTFDGASFAVSGLYCQKPGSSYAGLFASNAGIIKNLGVAGGTVSAGNYTGGLCGINKGTITGCYSAASVNGSKYTGGICGCNDSGATVSVCYNTGAVNGSKYVGGICGYNKNAASDCYNTGTVIGNSTSIGGICGYNRNLVSGCFNTGEVGGGTKYVGSVCGYNHSGSTFVNCYYLVTGTEKGNYGIGMTRQQFASGEVCWALNEGNGGSVVWRQTCGTGLPAFGGKTVYRTQTYKGDGSAAFAYTNDGNKKAAVPYTAPTAVSSGESTDENSGEHTSHVYPEPTWEWKKYESAKAVFTCQDCGEQLILKASVKKETTEPTCTEDGENVYTASVEKDGITYKDKRVVEKEKTGHREPLVQIAINQEATCEKPIYTKVCWKCEACKKYFDNPDGKRELSKTEVGYQNPLPHTFTTPSSYQWTDATYPAKPSATATFTCSVCQTQQERKANVIQLTRVEREGCETPGNITYKAEVLLDDGTPHTLPETKAVVIPAKGHSIKRNPANPLQYICTACKKTFSLNEVLGTTTDNTPSGHDANITQDDTETKNDMENRNLTPNETIPGDEGSTLPPDPEETPEAPTSSEGQNDSDNTNTPEGPGGADTSDIPDESGGADTPVSPNIPDNSDGQNTPDIPDKSDDGADTPVSPDVPDNSDAQNTPVSPDVPDNSDGQNTPDTPDIPDNSDGQNTPEIPDSTDSLNLPGSADEWNETETDTIEGTAVTFRTTPAVNGAVQAAAKQQGIPLWGLAVLLTLVTGIVLLVILRGKHD